MGSEPKSQELSPEEGGGTHELQLTCNGVSLDRGDPQVGLSQLGLTCGSIPRPADVERMAWGLAALWRWGLIVP